MDEQLQAYLRAHVPSRHELFLEMEQFAKDNHVPIMELNGIEFLLQIIRIQQPRTILEIGTAIGYSALRMAEACPNTRIISIERDEARFEVAEQFIQRAGKQAQITIVKEDALEAEQIIQQYGLFDMLFIDAAKGQYQRFFDIYEQYVTDNGIVISDNVLFQGLVYGENHLDKRKASMVKKIQAFNQALVHHPNYDTVIVPIGDGVAISRKRGRTTNE